MPRSVLAPLLVATSLCVAEVPEETGAPEPAPRVQGTWYPGYPEREVGQGLIALAAKDWVENADAKGINVFGWAMLGFQGNPVGGERQSTAATGLFDFGMQFDMEKLAGWTGGFFHVSGSWAFGENLTEDVGSFVPVNAVYSGDTLRFFEAYYEQNWGDDAWSLRAGRISVGWEYGVDYDFFTQYLSAAFRLNVFALDANTLNFSVIPTANWGVRLRWANESWRVQVSAMNGYPRDFAEDSKHGLQLDFRPAEGAFFIVEAAHVWSTRGGRPGRLAIGGYYDTGTFDALDGSGRQSEGVYTAYAIVRQKISSGAGKRGVHAWTAGAFGGREETAPVRAFWSGGLVWYGPSEERRDDSLVFGCATSWFSGTLPGATYETTLELAYSWVINPQFTVTPDIQYLIRPGGSGDIDDALILGVLLYVTF